MRCNRQVDKAAVAIAGVDEGINGEPGNGQLVSFVNVLPNFAKLVDIDIFLPNEHTVLGEGFKQSKHCRRVEHRAGEIQLGQSPANPHPTLATRLPRTYLKRK